MSKARYPAVETGEALPEGDKDEEKGEEDEEEEEADLGVGTQSRRVTNAIKIKQEPSRSSDEAPRATRRAENKKRERTGREQATREETFKVKRERGRSKDRPGANDAGVVTKKIEKRRKRIADSETDEEQNGRACEEWARDNKARAESKQGGGIEHDQREERESEEEKEVRDSGTELEWEADEDCVLPFGEKEL